MPPLGYANSERREKLASRAEAVESRISFKHNLEMNLRRTEINSEMFGKRHLPRSYTATP